MKICIIASQLQGLTRSGGYGSMARKIADELSNAGHEVSVLLPQTKGLKKFQKLGKLKVYAIGLKDIFGFKKLINQIDADIYHSQSPNVFTFFTLLAQKSKKHVITCRDPRDLKDWWIEFYHASFKRRLKTPIVFLFEEGPWIKYAVRNADVVGVPANFLKKKVTRMYGRENVILLPNLEDLPKKIPTKSKTPTVCYVGRLDKRKRPHLVLDAAEKLPDVKFMVVGKTEDKVYEKELYTKAKKLKNLKMLGYIDKHSEQKLHTIYSKSWILLNTAAREGLPLTFIEAAGRGCAIVSFVNPDNFAKKFGSHAAGLDFVKGIKSLLPKKWKRKGELGFEYVKETYDTKRALDTHIKIYKKLLKN